MTFSGRHSAATLFLGDILIFFISLWTTLLIRYGELPSEELFLDHAASFSLLFAVWILVFYMAGLYGKRVLLFKSALFGLILRTQIANIILAALFFFFMPNISIAPKTNLLLYLIVSLALILVWRLIIVPRIRRPFVRERAALIGAGPELQELRDEVNGNPHYHLSFVICANPEELSLDFEGFRKRLIEEKVTLLVVDADREAMRPHMPHMYELAFVRPGYPVLDFHDVYEEVFDRVPLSLLEYDWFLKNLSRTEETFYLVAKRAIDLIGGCMMGIITIVATPVLFILMRLEDSGPVFIAQERIGQYGTRIRAYKFRSMRQNKAASSEWTVEEKKDNPVTRVGSMLRLTSLDEFPQFINILKGELSLVGPRNDVEGLGKRLGEAIPYYNMRYIVKPGITGWAQINQKYEPGHISPQSIEETKVRLAYDFYYIKNRSLALDIEIALKTVKRMLFRMAG